jgi:hypothetical protein
MSLRSLDSNGSCRLREPKEKKHGVNKEYESALFWGKKEKYTRVNKV